LTALAAVAAVAVALGASFWLAQPPQNTVVIDKAAFVELLKAYNQKPGGVQGASSDANERLLKLVNTKLNDADTSYTEFVKRTTDLLGRLDGLRSLISSQVISEAKAEGREGDFRKAKAALQELLAQVERGKAEPAVAVEFGESLARAFAAVGDLSQSIETYADTVASVAPTGRLIRGYVEALLAAGQFQRAVSTVETALGSHETAYSSTDIAWMNDALGQAYESLGKTAVAKEKYAVAFQLMRTSQREGNATPSDLAAILNDMTAVSIRSNDMRTAKQSLCESIRLNTESAGIKDRSTLFSRLNLVGVSRQMGLLGAARQQLDDVKADIDGGLPPDDPLKGGAIIHAALLAIAENSSDAGLATITEAQQFFEKHAAKGQGYQQRMARIEQIKGIAHFQLGQWSQSYERELVSKDLFRRAFGGLSADELTSTFWLARSSIALNRRAEAEVLYQSLRAGLPTFEKEPGTLTLETDLLEAELALTGGRVDEAKAMLEKTIAALFEIEAKGESYLSLADDAIRLLLSAEGEDASVEAITLYRQARGQRILVRAGGGATC
jgi:tetratricopeptide (TPR) repeat protein